MYIGLVLRIIQGGRGRAESGVLADEVLRNLCNCVIAIRWPLRQHVTCAPPMFVSAVPLVKAARICAQRSVRLLFRGWSRLCIHAASLNATEGAMASATAAARATRTEAMEEEAKAAAEKAEALKRAAAAGAALAAAQEQAYRDTAANVSTTAAESKEKREEWESFVLEQKEHRAKMLVRAKFTGDRHVPRASDSSRGQNRFIEPRGSPHI